MPPTKSISTDGSGLAADAPAKLDWPVLIVMLSGTFMVVLDFFIVNVAVPSIQRDLLTSAGAIQFVVAGYGIANAAGLITGGRLGDLFGPRRMFAIGLALFILASAACGLAPNATVLVIARVLQGFAGALLQPQVLAMLGLIYTGPRRARAFAAYGLTLGLGAMLGQLVGGVLIDADIAGLGWRACFLINVPIGVAALVLTPRLLPSLKAQGGSGLDLTGTMLVTVGLVAVILPLVEGRQQGWPMWSWLCLASSLPVMMLFAGQQRRLAARGGAPLVAPSLFAHPGFVIGLLITLTFYAGNASFYFVLALYMQQGMGLGALASGLIFTVAAIGFFATSMAGPWFARRIGSQSIALGALVLAAGHALQLATITVAANGNAVFWMVPVLLIEGAGIGMIMAPMVSTVLADIPSRYAGVASGLLATVQQVGNALGVALIGILFYGGLGDSVNRDSYANAFSISLIYLLVLALAVAALVQRMLQVRVISAGKTA